MSGILRDSFTEVVVSGADAETEDLMIGGSE